MGTKVYVIVRDNLKKDFLLVHTSDGWCFPSGRVENEIYPEDDAMRHVYEQTNIRCRVYRETKKIVRVKKDVALYFEADHLYGNAEIHSPEIKDFRWCGKEKALELLTPEAIPPQWK